MPNTDPFDALLQKALQTDDFPPVPPGLLKAWQPARPGAGAKWLWLMPGMVFVSSTKSRPDSSRIMSVRESPRRPSRAWTLRPRARAACSTSGVTGAGHSSSAPSALYFSW